MFQLSGCLNLVANVSADLCCWNIKRLVLCPGGGDGYFHPSTANLMAGAALRPGIEPVFDSFPLASHCRWAEWLSACRAESTRGTCLIRCPSRPRVDTEDHHIPGAVYDPAARLARREQKLLGRLFSSTMNKKEFQRPAQIRMGKLRKCGVGL